jgi:hypothetical protein
MSLPQLALAETDETTLRRLADSMGRTPEAR